MAQQIWVEATRTVSRVPGVDMLVTLGHRHLITFLRFLLVGFSGVFVNMGILWFLTEVGGVYYLASSLVAVEASIVTNFLINNAWTFRERSLGVIRLSALARYNLICAGGIAASTTILYLLATFAGLHYLVANMAAISVTALWNFGANVAWTWRRVPEESVSSTNSTVSAGGSHF